MRCSPVSSVPGEGEEKTMNSSLENNAHFEGNNARPFFYVHAMAHQPYPGHWYQNPTYNPFSVPGAGLRNGSLYFPYSVVLSECPGFLVPQSPLPTTLNRRPIFPVFYNPAQLRHCSGYGKKMKTKETQTALQQAENMSEKQDIHSEGSSRDIGRVTSIPTTNVDIETDNIPEKTDGALSSVAQKRELHDKSPSSNTLCRNTPHGSFASEKEKLGIEQGEGSLVIQFWKTLKETMRLYELAYGEAMPENMVRHSGISESPCESRGVLCNPLEDEDCFAYEDEQRAVQSEQHGDVVRHDEILKAGLIVEINLGKEKKGYSAVPQILPSPDEIKDADKMQNTLISKLCQSTGDGNKLQQERPLGISMETVNDLSLQYKSQNPITTGERKSHNSSGSHGSPEKLDEEEVVESNNYSQGCVPSPTWVAQFNQVDEGIMCDMSWWLEAEVEKSPESSPESSRKGIEEKPVGSRGLSEDEVVESNSYPEKYVPSSTSLAQSKQVDVGIMCNMSLCQGEEVRTTPEEILSEDEESSPDCRTKGSEKSSRSRELDEDEMVESSSYPQGCLPSPTWLTQFNRVDEGIQCDMSWWQDAELEKFSEQMPAIDEESSPDCKVKGSRKKSIRNRKVNTDEEEMSVNDDTEEVYNENFKKYARIKTVKGRKLNALSRFSNGKIVYLLKKNTALNIVLPEDSEDYELEEEVEDEIYEIECLFEKVSPQGLLTSSKGRLYHKSGRIIRMLPDSSLPPQLIVWPTRTRYKLKRGEYESIPVVYKVKGQDGCEITYGRLRKEHTMAKQEGLESKRASHKSLGCNCERSKAKVPYKLTSKHRDSRQML